MKQILMLFLSIPLVSTAQNIVLNPNFSEYVTCPPSQSQINLCKYWYNVTYNTPDYWHACNPHPFYGYPGNFPGHQISSSNAMVGAFTFSSDFPNIREYFGADIPALTIGDIYKVTVRVSLGDTMGYGTNGLGVFFYVDAKPDTTLKGRIPVTPQIDYSSYGVIADKVNWTTLTANFVADSAFTHMVLGNFKLDNSILFVSVPPSWNAYAKTSYYYYDSVSVERIGKASVVSTPNKSNIRIYPSPTDKTLTIASDHMMVSVIITNLMGQTLYNYNPQKREVQVDVSSLPKGIYFVRVDHTAVSTFVKQ